MNAPTNGQLETLRHMLGMTDFSRREPSEYRDYYCANKGDEHLMTLEAEGLVRCYRRDDAYHWYTTTDAGKDAARASFRQLRYRKSRRVYLRYLSVNDAVPDLTFREFLTDPEFADIRRDA